MRDYLRDNLRFFQKSGVQTLADITLERVRDWDNHIARIHKPATRARYRNSLRAFLEYAQAYLGMPSLGDGISPINVPVHDPKLPTQEELVLLLEAQRPYMPIEFRDAAIICFIALTGARRSEVVAAKLGDVSFDKDHFQVFLTAQKKSGQRRIVNFGNLDKPYDITAVYFGQYFVKRFTELGGRNKAAAARAPLFAAVENPYKHLHERSINEIFDAAVSRVPADAGVRPLSFVTPHILRHFFATRSAINGMRIEAIQIYLGHANISTTERYIHLAEKISGDQARLHGPMVGMKAPTERFMGNSDQQLNYFRLYVPPAP